ncbi:ABC transporter ATP-binding protein [Mongoliimonas terrestris]|uniref:ABC transporter ATP-binding protein n=1 Tax=Mongoliimonas terrestris TaxID=1709001 RepID=UPI0009499900|nr:ABC transporter ATP-binding protein [Mongoliimonas terrestris]
MSFLKLSAVSKAFGANVVVKSFDLSVRKGEFVSFLGPSGCGKTTVLRMVSGFERPTSGAIEIGGRDVTHLPANQRQIGMVFQSYALFPNMSVFGNVAFGLKIAGASKPEIASRVKEMLDLIQLGHLADRYPYQLSGGQQQRVALARALAARPQVLLLDEPLSALDAKIRVSLRDDIRAIQRELNITTIFVTHDQEEALTISDRVVVMNGGIAEQCDTPHEIYNRPTTRFVAGFVGKLNNIPAIVVDPDAGTVRVESDVVTLEPRAVAGRKAGDPIVLALRPEAVSMGTRSGDVVLEAKVQEVYFLGSVIRLKVAAAGVSLSLDIFNRADAPPPDVGSTTHVSFSSHAVIVLDS